jgi:peptidoglycan/LPS O-acetylase OafA/YrhL
MPPSTTPHSAHKLYFPAVDGLRALAVLSVLVFHLNSAWLPGGFTGVDVFFVISGFVVCASVASLPMATFWQLCSHFYARRILRIGPALVMCLVISGLLSTLFIPQAWLSEANHETGFMAFFGLSNFAMANTTGDYFSPRAEFNPFTHTWSLAVEEQFYLLFPALIYGVTSARSARVRATWLAVMGAAVLASLACSAYWGQTAPAKAFYLLPSRYWELGVGVMAWMNLPRIQARIRQLPAQACNRLAILVMIGLALSMCFAQSHRFPFPWALLPVLSTALLLMLFASRADFPLARLFAHRAALWVGLRSYSLYLWHWPIDVLMRWTVGLEGPLEQAIAVLLSFTMAALSYRYIELPVRQGARIKALGRPAGVVLGLSFVSLAALFTGAMFKFKPYISLSVTRDAAVWFPYDASAPPLQANCHIQKAKQGLGGGEAISYTPSRCQTAPRAATLFVAGDSHAVAYSLMLQNFAAHTGTTVHLLDKGGCAFFSLYLTKADTTPDCSAFHAAALQRIRDTMKPGDVLFLPSLRLPRLGDQWHQPEKPISMGIQDTRDHSAAVAEAIQDLQPLRQSGLIIAFEAPKPVLPSPAFRCSDWFNRHNPVCSQGLSIPRTTMDQYRQGALQAVMHAASGLDSALVWDPYPLLCGTEVCSAFRDGKPLFFDGDHVSGHANRLLLDDFTAFMNRAWSHQPERSP